MLLPDRYILYGSRFITPSIIPKVIMFSYHWNIILFLVFLFIFNIISISIMFYSMFSIDLYTLNIVLLIENILKWILFMSLL
jgi:hypothetical protein